MKKLTVVALLSVFSVLAFATAGIWSFKAQSSGDDVNVEWRTSTENGIDHFDVYRASGSATDFQKINSTPIAPKGDNSTYTFTDRAVFKPTDGFFKYQLSIVNQDGTVQNAQTSVYHSVSGVKRTWGSIKAMFR